MVAAVVVAVAVAATAGIVTVRASKLEEEAMKTKVVLKFVVVESSEVGGGMGLEGVRGLEIGSLQAVNVVVQAEPERNLESGRCR